MMSDDLEEKINNDIGPVTRERYQINAACSKSNAFPNIADASRRRTQKTLNQLCVIGDIDWRRSGEKTLDLYHAVIPRAWAENYKNEANNDPEQYRRRDSPQSNPKAPPTRVE